MGRANLIQNNFTGGEVSPRFYMRVDNPRYKAGVKKLQNLKIAPQGGAISREGTVFVEETKYRDMESRLFGFQFSTEQAYIIEAGDEYYRFYKDNDIITLANITITGISKANPGVISYTGTDPSNGDEVFVSGVVGMTQVNGKRYVVANVDTGANTFEMHDINDIAVNTTSYTTYVSGGVFNKIVDIASPYTEDQLFEIDFTQSADTFYSVHGDVKPYTLTRSSDTAWTSAPIVFVDGPYLDENSTTTTLTPSGTGTSVNMTFSATTGVNGGQGFLSTDVGRLIRFHDGSNWFYYRIDSRTSSTVAAVTRLSEGTPGGTTATKRWQLGAWSDTTGWPEAICFFEQRLFFGSCANQPDTFWGSAIDDFVNFTPGTDDSDAVTYTLASEKVNRIRWMSPVSNTLRIGTSGNEFTVSGSDTTASLGPTNIKVKRESAHGSSLIKPVQVDNATLFFQRANRKLRELVYNYEVDGLVAPDLTVISSHITEGGIHDMSFQAEPDAIIWICRNDGKLIGLTYLRAEDIVGWHRHVIGGPKGTKAESVAVIPIDNPGQDQVWIIVRRIIDGEERRYIERIGNNFFDNSNNTVKDACFVDSSLSYTGTTKNATLTPGATTGSNITFTAGSSVFTAADVGKHIRTTYVDDDGTMTESKAIITTYNSGTVVHAMIAKDFVDTSAIPANDWTLSTDYITGFLHAIGQEFTILADGGVHPKVTVDATGGLQLNGQYTKVHSGFGYIQEIETLDLEGSSVIGSVQGSKARITEFIIRLYKSVGFKYGFDENNLDLVDFRVPSDEMDEGVPLYTGDKIKRPPNAVKNAIKMIIRQEQPLPLNVLGFICKVESSDAP